MTDFSSEPKRHSLVSSPEENDIRAIFYNHWLQMKTRFDEDCERINRWSKRCIQEIKLYAEEQIRILRDFYNEQRVLFDKERDTALNIAKNCHKAKEKDYLFADACNSSKKLEFQLADLECILAQFSFPRVKVAKKFLLEGKQSTVQAPRLQFGNHRQNSNDSTSQVNNVNENATKTSAVKASISANASKEASSADSNPATQCPICFMLFSSAMSPKTRSRHVNAHMTDDSIDNEPLRC